MRWSLSRSCNKSFVAWVHCGFVFIYLPVHVLYSGLICCFDVLKRARGFPVACSPRWMPLKRAFSSFQHLVLLQILRLSNFKEICPRNSRIIPFVLLLSRRYWKPQITHGNQVRWCQTLAVLMPNRLTNAVLEFRNLVSSYRWILKINK